jgi:hypothetical protein
MNSKRKEILLISGLILFSIILFIAGQGDLQYKIGLLGNIILVLISVLVWGFTFFYILRKLFLNTKNAMRIDFFKISFFASLTLFIMTLPIINYCDGWQTRQDMGNGLSEYLKFIGIISFVYLLFLAIIYLVNIILSLTKYLKKKNTLKNVFFSFIIPLISFFLTIMFFFITNSIGLNENGKCDIITGPSDSGLSYILFITIIMNLVQYKISADNIVYKK